MRTRPVFERYAHMSIDMTVALRTGTFIEILTDTSMEHVFRQVSRHVRTHVDRHMCLGMCSEMLIDMWLACQSRHV